MRRQPWPIRKTFITLNLIFIVCSLLIIILASFLFIMPKYYSYESRAAEQRVDQLNNLIEMEIEHLDLYCRDWALWTDTWNFIQDGNTEYVDSNLGAASLEIGGLSFFFFFNLEGDLVHASWIDPETGVFFDNQDLQLPVSLEKLLFTGAGEMEELVEKGIIGDQSGEKVYLFSAHNILKSDGSGPSVGTLLAGRIMDKNLLYELGEALNINIDLHHRSIDGAVPLKTAQDISYEVKKTPIFSKENWTIVFPLTLRIPEIDIYLIFEHQTDILYEGIRTVFMINIIFTIIFILLLGLYQFWVSMTILRPILKLTGYVEQKCLIFNSDEDLIEEKSNEIVQLSKRFHYLLEKFAIQNKTLSIQAQTDDLSGLDRRYPVLERLEAECHRHDPEVLQTVCVLMIDIDHFKRVNDTWGHPVGDEVIKGIAPVLRSCLRDADVVGRYGGEEFIIILKDLSSDIVLILAERIRSKIEQSEWSFGESITVSIGYMNKSCPCKPSELIEEADAYLYKAKDNGRNRVEGAEAISS